MRIAIEREEARRGKKLRREKSFMKNAATIGIMAATVLLGGCGKQSSSDSITHPPGSQPVAVSDGSNTWHLGAVTINGTNVQGTNITIGVRTGAVSK